jgi:hypothetical protein
VTKPTDPEPDYGPDVPIGDVFCPFSGDGRCPGNPPCPTNRDRACTGDEDDL